MIRTTRNKDNSIQFCIVFLNSYHSFHQCHRQHPFTAAAAAATLGKFCAHFCLRCCHLPYVLPQSIK